MYSIRRSGQSALRSSNGIAACANGSRRAFSHSAARSKGGLPVYLGSSSSELESLLARINSKVLLPEFLTSEQQKLVYKQKSRPKLETEPVEVTIGDVTLPLEHIDRNHQPSRSNSLTEIVKRCVSTADWENLVRVLEGYHSAGMTIRPHWQELVVRKLNENGHHSIVLKALQRVKATGLRLSTRSVAVQVLEGAHQRAVDSDWDMEETIAAMRYARQVVELMEEKEHHAVSSKKGSRTSPTDWRSTPFVVAVPTELAAKIAQKHGGDVEVTKNLANRLVNALNQDKAAVTPESHEPQAVQDPETIDRVIALGKQTENDFQSRTAQRDGLHAFCQGLFELTVIWNALKTSRAVLGANMPLAADAAKYESRIKQVLDEGIEALPKVQKRAYWTFKSRYPAYIQGMLQES